MNNASKSKLDADQLAQLVADHQLSVWRYLRSLGCQSQEAEDLTQDTFLKVWQRPFQEMADVATRSYLRRVAKNLLVDKRRKEGRGLRIQGIESIENFWSEQDVQKPEELLGLLAECLNGLTDRARLALELRFQDKKSRVEIAEKLEIGEHGAKNLMQRAKQQLRDCIEFKQDKDIEPE